MRRLVYAVLAVATFLAIELVRSVAFEPFNWYIGKWMDKHPDAPLGFAVSILAPMFNAFVAIPSKFFAGTALGIAVSAAIFYRIYLADNRRKARIETIKRWRTMAVEAQANVDIDSSKVDQASKGLTHLQRHTEYETFMRTYNYEMARYRRSA